MAMAWPAEGKDKLYRNPAADVKRFLDERHGGGHYRVYNLCSERDYDPALFDGEVEHYLIHDHNPATMDQLFRFCVNLDVWLEQHPLNVAAVHCKAVSKGQHDEGET